MVHPVGTGPEHPLTLMNMRILSSLLVAQERYEEAEAHLIKGLKIIKQKLGLTSSPDNKKPNNFTTKSNNNSPRMASENVY